MASNFAKAVEAIRVQFIAVRAERGRGIFEDARWLIGRNAIETHKSVPYVGWVRAEGTLGRPKGLNPIRDGNTSVSSSARGALDRRGARLGARAVECVDGLSVTRATPPR